MKYVHVTKGTTATMSEPNVLVIDGTNERLEVSDITLRRWWKAVEEDKPAAAEPMKMSETITALEVLFDKLNGIYFEGKLRPRKASQVRMSHLRSGSKEHRRPQNQVRNL